MGSASAAKTHDERKIMTMEMLMELMRFLNGIGFFDAGHYDQSMRGRQGSA